MAQQLMTSMTMQPGQMYQAPQMQYVSEPATQIIQAPQTTMPPITLEQFMQMQGGMQTAQPSMMAAPGYVLQPNFGMVPVPADALVNECTAEIAEEASVALVTFSFRPKKLSADEKEELDDALKAKAKEDAKKSFDEKAKQDKIAIEEEEDFWKESSAKQIKVYLKKGKCEPSHIYDPIVKQDGSGVRSYDVEIRPTGDAELSEELKDLAKWNEFVKIAPVIRKKDGYPPVVFECVMRLADCQSSKCVLARKLTDKANVAQKAVIASMQKVEDLTLPAVKAQEALNEAEISMKRAEVTSASMTKYKNLLKTKGETSSEFRKAEDQAVEAKVAKAKAAEALQKAETESDEALRALKEAKKDVVAAEFDVTDMVAKADKARRDVPASCELFTGAIYMCDNGCGYQGTKADCEEHEKNCEIEYSCDAPDCDFKGNFTDCSEHEKNCPKLKAVNQLLGMPTTYQPQVINLGQQFGQLGMGMPMMGQPMQMMGQPMMGQPMQMMGQPTTYTADKMGMPMM